MPTKTKARVRKTSYWWKTIERARNRKRKGLTPVFTDQERLRAKEWVTCACGRQDDRLHDGAGIPIDQILFDLGCEFAGAVCDLKQPATAARILTQIERRAAVLLAEMEKR